MERTTDFSSALDCLMEISGDLGFTQVLYAYLPRPARLPNGDWLPLKLNVRNFPRGWEDGWDQFMCVDPYYRACFDGTMLLMSGPNSATGRPVTGAEERPAIT